MANLINKTQLGTEYLNTVNVWNDSTITKINDSIVDSEFNSKEQLVQALHKWVLKLMQTQVFQLRMKKWNSTITLHKRINCPQCLSHWGLFYGLFLVNQNQLTNCVVVLYYMYS